MIKMGMSKDLTLPSFEDALRAQETEKASELLDYFTQETEKASELSDYFTQEKLGALIDELGTFNQASSSVVSAAAEEAVESPIFSAHFPPNTGNQLEHSEMLLDYLPEELKKANLLTQAAFGEHREVKQVGSNRKLANRRSDPGIGENIKVPVKISSDTKKGAEKVASQVNYLCVSEVGKGLIRKLRKSPNAELLSKSLAKREVVVFSKACLGNEVPFHWMSLFTFINITRILKEFEQGTWKITIDDSHPQKELILQAMNDLAEGPTGRKLLLDLDQGMHKQYTIIYTKGECYVNFNYRTIGIDAMENHGMATVSADGAYLLPLFAKLSHILGHELIHVYQEMSDWITPEKRPTSPANLHNSMKYDEVAKRYFGELGPLYKSCTSALEQETIFGVWKQSGGERIRTLPISENMIRYEQGAYLRFGHVYVPAEKNCFANPISNFLETYDIFEKDISSRNVVDIAIRKQDVEALCDLFSNDDTSHYAELVTALENYDSDMSTKDDFIQSFLKAVIQNGPKAAEAVRQIFISALYDMEGSFFSQKIKLVEGILLSGIALELDLEGDLDVITKVSQEFILDWKSSLAVEYVFQEIEIKYGIEDKKNQISNFKIDVEILDLINSLEEITE